MIRPINANNFNFKGKYLIQVPKNQFSEPDKLEQCEDEFEKVLASEIYKNIKGTLFSKKKSFFSFLEAPNYASTVDISSYGLSWIKAHTGIEINEPKDPNYHSFVVITKNESKKMAEKISKKNLKAIEKAVNKEQEERDKQGLIADKIWEQAVCYKYFNKALDESCNDVETNETIILNSLDEIPFAVSEMDI